MLPAEVTDIVIYICYADEPMCDRNQCSVGALSGTSPAGETCRPSEGLDEFGERPVLVRRDLRTDVPVTFLVAGSVSGAYQYLGQAGPMVLGEGQRRQVELFMYPVGSSSVLEADVPALMPSVSALPDGRVLIAGGFSSASESTCPAERMYPDGTRCYDLIASDTAVAFDVATRTATPVRSRMLEARGGHSATVLPDGRVLLAGGAPRALAAFVPVGDVMSGRFGVEITPLTSDGSDGAHASFELFDAFLGQEPTDPDRDGDPGRGGFLGTSGTMSAGALNAPRFLHAAAAVTGTGQVVLAGGLGGGASSYEVFDANKAGGFGVYQSGGALSVARPMPGAVSINGQVWIFGGGGATSNADLADIWAPAAGEPNGAITVASEATEFPNISAGVEQDEPRFSHVRPNVVPVANGERPLVVGWYGTQCNLDGSGPVFSAVGVPTELCNPPGAGARTAFTVSTSGVTTPTNVRPRAFGAAVELWRRPIPEMNFVNGTTGEIALTGGIANLTLTGQPGIEVFTGMISSTGEATTDSTLSASLSTQRFLHGSASAPGGAIVTAGGGTFDTLRGLVLTQSIEVTHIAGR